MLCFKASIPILKTLCDETRLHILSLLSQGELNACEINREFHCTQPTISYHMRLLVDAELVLARREGCQVIYSINNDVWPSIQGLLTALCKTNRGRKYCQKAREAEGESL